MSDIWIFPLEPLDGRYTQQWYDEIPKIFKKKFEGTDRQVYNVVGMQQSDKPTSGAFLDFADTNFWKSSQLATFAKTIQETNSVADDADILFTDFWNPAILQVAYMRDLLSTNWRIHSIAHAGAYDPTDILGLKMRKPWPYEAERAFFYAADYTYFGTNFHRDMFLKNLNIPPEQHHRAVVSGQPHDAILKAMEQVQRPTERCYDIVWPHRYNEDKQPEIAENLSSDFSVLITKKQDLTKAAYYEALASSKVIFSCSLHENLGISVMEGVLLDVIPLVPDRCSYSEMYLPEFKYPSQWTENWEYFEAYRPQLVGRINQILNNTESYNDLMKRQKRILKENYLSAHIMTDQIIDKK